MNLPDKKYNIIYADPPWSYYGGEVGSAGRSIPYPTLLTGEICNLDIPSLCEEDCVLFIWGVWSKLQDCLDVIKAWGFKFNSLGFIWVKRTSTGRSWQFGMGGWTRRNSEYCLIATKGNPKCQDNSISEVLTDPVREHSRKPDVVRNLIVRLCGYKPRIELFSRNRVEGWDVWGNQVPDFTQKLL